MKGGSGGVTRLCHNSKQVFPPKHGWGFTHNVTKQILHWNQDMHPFRLCVISSGHFLQHTTQEVVFVGSFFGSCLKLSLLPSRAAFNLGSPRNFANWLAFPPLLSLIFVTSAATLTRRQTLVKRIHLEKCRDEDTCPFSLFDLRSNSMD